MKKLNIKSFGLRFFILLLVLFYCYICCGIPLYYLGCLTKDLSYIIPEISGFHGTIGTWFLGFFVSLFVVTVFATLVVIVESFGSSLREDSS